MFLKILLSLSLLMLGGIIYLGYRNEALLLFEWAHFLGLDAIVHLFRTYASHYLLSSWIIYSLPDGMWLLSYMLIIDLLWGESDISQNFWLYILPFIAIISELSQLIVPSHGTFDFLDLCCYFIAIILFKTLKYLKL